MAYRRPKFDEKGRPAPWSVELNSEGLLRVDRDTAPQLRNGRGGCPGNSFKHRVHAGLAPQRFHFRDAKGHEVDVVIKGPRRLRAVEIKSGRTVAVEAVAPLPAFRRRLAGDPLGRAVEATFVYGGGERLRHDKRR